MSELNKMIVRRIIEEGFNQGHLEVIDELVAPEYVNHSDNVHGIEGYKQFITIYRKAFPDLHMTLEAQIAEGELESHRWSAYGTHEGELMGIPASNQEINITGTYCTHIVDGKVTEEWGNFDAMSMMQQIGALGT